MRKFPTFAYILMKVWYSFWGALLQVGHRHMSKQNSKQRRKLQVVEHFHVGAGDRIGGELGDTFHEKTLCSVQGWTVVFDMPVCLIFAVSGKTSELKGIGFSRESCAQRQQQSVPTAS